MARKREAPAPTESPPATVPPPSAPETPTSPSDPNGQKRKPEVSYRCFTDRTTRLEVAVWANEMTGQDGSTYKQHAITFSRNYKDGSGTWVNDSRSYRAHDLPVLLYLLDRAYKYTLDSRTEDSAVPF
jgi:hypothetical protein